MTDTGIREVIVIGSCPAGYTAALYTARAERGLLVFGGAIFVGGSLTTANRSRERPATSAPASNGSYPKPRSGSCWAPSPPASARHASGGPHHSMSDGGPAVEPLIGTPGPFQFGQFPSARTSPSRPGAGAIRLLEAVVESGRQSRPGAFLAPNEEPADGGRRTPLKPRVPNTSPRS